MRTRFVATVEVEADTLGEVADLREALAEFEPSVHPVQPGLWQVRMVIRAEGLAAACSCATSVAQAATGAPAVSALVVSEHQHELQQAHESWPPPPLASAATRRSAVGATRGRSDLDGVLSGTYRLRSPDHELDLEPGACR